MATAGHAERAGRVAVSGAAGRLGGLLVRRLHRRESVLAIDPRPFPARPADVEHARTDLRRKACRDLFRRGLVRAAIHLGPFHSAGSAGEEGDFAAAVEDFARLLDYCDRYEVKKLVVLSSADVYGARPHNPQFLAEDAPLLAEGLSALRDVDMMAQSFFWRRPDVETVILRPAHIVGAVSGTMARYLRLDPAPRLLGYDPPVQLVHEEDVVQAILLALGPGQRGIFNLAGPSPLPLARVLSRLGRRTVALPHVLARPALSHLRQLGGARVNPAHVDYLRFVCMVDDARARATLGYRPRHDLAATIAAVDLWE